MVKHFLWPTLLVITGCGPLFTGASTSDLLIGVFADEDPCCATADYDRQTRWGVGESIVVIAEPFVGTGLFGPYPAPESFATIVVLARTGEEGPSGTLSLIYQAEILGRETFEIQRVDQGENELRIRASNERVNVLLCVQGPPSEDYDGLLQEAESIVGAESP